jgi:hypothetical protein
MLYNGFTNGPQGETSLFNLSLNWALNLDVYFILQNCDISKEYFVRPLGYHLEGGGWISGPFKQC